jgi:signal transduction histidine kinase
MMWPPQKHPLRSWRSTLPLLGGILALGGLSLFLPIRVRFPVVASGTACLLLVATWVLIQRHRQGGPGRQFFLFLALAVGIHGVLDCFDLLGKYWIPWFQMGTGARLTLKVMGPVLQFLAVYFWPTEGASRSLRSREILDALLFTTSLFLIFWLLGLGDLVAGAPLPARQKIIQLWYLLDYALLMGMALYRGLNTPGRFANALGWLLATFGVVAAGNLGWIYLHLHGRYYFGHPMDGTALVIAVLYLLTAFGSIPEPAAHERMKERKASLILPYLPFMLALPLAVQRVAHGANSANAAILWLVLGMITALLLRQFSALWDSYRFSRRLEAQVQQRTQALMESQAMLLRTQRLNLLATLGAGLAHDLNNLLSVVGLTTDLMEEDLEAGRPPERKDFNALRRASSQASDMVKKLMAFGRSDEASEQVFDLSERIEGMVKLLEKLATPSIQLRWEPCREPLRLKLDPALIEQILVNLVANARDAMPTGGRLSIRTERNEGLDGSWAVLTVEDSGTGIPEAHLGRLFEAFFTTKESGKGTGLGLASVKAIAEASGATIAVASQLGVGTIFTLRFPLPCVEEAGMKTADVTAGRG